MSSRPYFPSRPLLTVIVGIFAILVASLVLGGATSFAQGMLPAALQPFANSASGWTILTALLVWAARRGTRESAVLGMVSFVALVLGYTVASDARGFSFDPVFWSAVGLVAGPCVGAAAAALHQRGRWAAVGGGLLAGILLGDSYYGLTVVAASTGRTYWILAGGLGVALLVALSARPPRTAPLILLMTAVAVGVAGLMNVGYALLSAGVVSVAGGS